MPIDIIECPHCSARVVPMTDGTCPACRQNTQEAPGPEADTRTTRDRAWEKYQESLRSAPVEPALGALRQVEQQFAELRERALAGLRANAGRDQAAADQIDQELLPRYVRAVEQLRQEAGAATDTNRGTSQLMDYATTRAESWQLLAEALRENDAEKLQRHIELREESEMLMVGIVGAGQSLAKPNPVQRVRQFQRALATFTPRLIGTPAVVIVNILVFIAMIATGVHFLAPTAQSVLEWGANFGPKTMNGQWWRLVTCMFLHFGVLHLAFNMWVLWDLGRIVERLVGNVGFIVLYFVSGIAGSIASLAWNPLVVSAGASGAVFGVAGALLGLVSFRRDTVPVAVLKQLRSSMVAFLLYNLLYGMTASGIDMAAHVGGLATGFVCGVILSQPLSREMVARRWSRNVAVLVAGGIALPLAAVALPDAPPDIDGEMRRFAETEKRAIDTYNALVHQSQRGVITDDDFVDTLEHQVLAPWTEVRESIEGLADVPYARADYLSKVVQYLRCREESWRMQVEGLREQDPTKLEQARARWTAAEEMVKELAAR